MGAAALFAVSCSQHSASPRPNVVIIYADDVGYGDLSCNGEPTVHTPNVERLSAQGVTFTNAHSPAATSTPARYGLLTGQYPWRKEGTGIAAGDAGMIISPDTYTMADMFKDAGYATAAVGKWHLGLGETSAQDWNGTVSPALCDIGFDYSYIMAATADRVPCVYIEDGRVVNLDPEDPISVSYVTPFEGEPLGCDHPELLKMYPSHRHDQAIVNGVSRLGYMKGGKKALWVDETIVDTITTKACDFITAHKDAPFFLYFGTNDIHVPRLPNERFVGTTTMGPRGDAIMSFDWAVGRVLDVLDSLGLTESTIVVLSSDNGPVVDDGYKDDSEELLGEHRPWGDFRGGKYSAYEAGTRVPMIVRWPGYVEAGTSSDRLVSHIDFFRSFADVLGVELPSGAAPDSEDNLPTLLGGGEDRDFAIGLNTTGTMSIISDDWKYIEPHEGSSVHAAKGIELGNSAEPQLYDLRTDIGERDNVYMEHKDIADSLAMLLETQKKLH